MPQVKTWDCQYALKTRRKRPSGTRKTQDIQFIGISIKLLAAALLFFILSADTCAQQWFPTNANTDINGYISELPLITFRTDSSFIGFQNIIHGRLNTAWYPFTGLTVTAAGRLELLTGTDFETLVSPGSNLPLLRQDIGYADLTGAWPSVLYGNIDRAFVSFSNNAFVINAGRQRINWSTNLVWNPNDWFNTYNYFDFDYEERPGTDGLRLIYYFGPVSSLELALKANHNLSQRTYALMYHFNYSGFDYQFQGGMFGQDAALGFSWDGDILGGGFRGEASGYLPVLKSSDSFAVQDSAVFVVALSADYTFSNSLYWLTEAIYNGFGGSANKSEFVLRTQSITAKMLIPATYMIYSSAAYPFTDLITGTFAVMYPPGQNSYFLGPSATISLFQNVELLILGQIFFGTDRSAFGQTFSVFGGRLRWSF